VAEGSGPMIELAIARGGVVDRAATTDVPRAIREAIRENPAITG